MMTTRCNSLVVFLAVASVAAYAVANDTATPTDSTTFDKTIAPFTQRYCVGCHGGSTPKADLRIEQLDHDVTAGEHQEHWAAILRMISSGEMPPKDATDHPTAEERRTVTQWLDAKLPDHQQSSHWAFKPLTDSNERSIDWFVDRELTSKGLSLSPREKPRRLLRRVFLTLIGLPPSQAESDAFADDPSPANLETMVDDLLARPQYGERWGRHWLDLARYADSNGLHQDRDRPNAWRYRDYVINSFNEDKPYGQFIREQLAGDEIDPTNPTAWIATGFCRSGPSNDTNIAQAELEQYNLDQLDDIISTTTLTFLGQNIACARCHNHKVEPLTLTDYYRLAAVFKTSVPAYVPLTKDGAVGSPEHWAPKPRDRRKLPEGAQIRALTDTGPKPELTRVLLRGKINAPGDEVGPAIPQVLATLDASFTIRETERTTGRRTALADWIGSRDNALTWRVIANRIWQHHFGRGIVDTPNNFGVSGSAPSHPKLLDWLACRIRDNGGHFKPIHKMIVLSKTYTQSSAYRSDAAETDRETKLLWRYPPHRWEAEAVRDSILSISGNLNLKAGGPGIKPRIPAELLQASKRNTWPKVTKETPEHWRRSVYIYVKRQLPMPLLTLFDTPDSSHTCAKRFVSTTPTQALALMNDAFVNEQAKFVATRVMDIDRDDQVRELMERVYAVPAVERRVRMADEFVSQRLSAHASKSDPRLNALVDLAVVLFNSSPFLYVD